MKKVFPLVGSSLLTIAVISTLINAQSGSPVPKPTEKATAFKSQPGEQAGNQSGVGTGQLSGNSLSEDTIKPGTSEAAVEAQKLYASAVGLYEAGKLDEAIEAFKQSAKLRPDDAQTHFSLGMVYSQSRAYKDASDSFKRAVKLKPDWPEANFRVGMMAYVLGRRSQSLEAYNKLLKLNSPFANTLYRIINEGNTPATVAKNTSAGRESSTKTVELVPASSLTIETKTNNATRSDSSAANRSGPANPPALTAAKESRPERATDPPASVTSAPTSNPANDQPLTSVYRVGVGDVLDVRLLNSTTPRSTLYTVVDGGLIDFPIAGGPVSVGGLTTDEIQARIAGELKRRAVESNSLVTVGVRQYSSHSIIVTGLVSNPGTRFLRREAVPLYVVMAEVQPRSDAGRVTIMSSGGEKRTVDVNDASALSALVRPGDVVSVSARPQEFYYIAGRVNYPGQKPFQSGITLVQAILAAGGTVRQNDNDIDLSREGQDGRLSTTRYNLKDIKSGKVQDPRLQPGDRIEVVH